MALLQRGPPLGPWPDGASRRPPDENQPMDYLDVMWYLTKYKNISTTVIRLKAQNFEISFTAFWYSVYILQINIYVYTCTFYTPFESSHGPISEQSLCTCYHHRDQARFEV